MPRLNISDPEEMTSDGAENGAVDSDSTETSDQDKEGGESSDSESEEEEDEEVVDERFRSAVKAALGDAAQQSEDEEVRDQMGLKFPPPPAPSQWYTCVVLL